MTSKRVILTNGVTTLPEAELVVGVEFWHNRFGWWFQIHFAFASSTPMWRPTFRWAERSARRIVVEES